MCIRSLDPGLNLRIRAIADGDATLTEVLLTSRLDAYRKIVVQFRCKIHSSTAQGIFIPILFEMLPPQCCPRNYPGWACTSCGPPCRGHSRYNMR